MIIRRVKILAEALNMSISGLEKSLNLGNSTLSKAIAGDKSIGSNIIEKIFAEYPNVSPKWFVLGIGDIFLEDCENPTTSITEPTPQTKSTQENEELEEKKYVIKLQKQRIQELEEKIKAYETAKQTPQRSMAYTTNQ